MLSLVLFHRMFLKTINVIHIIITTTITDKNNTTTITDMINIIDTCMTGYVTDQLTSFAQPRLPPRVPVSAHNVLVSRYWVSRYCLSIKVLRYRGIRISRFKVSGYICHFLYSKRLAPASNCSQSHGESSTPETSNETLVHSKAKWLRFSQCSPKPVSSLAQNQRIVIINIGE